MKRFLLIPLGLVLAAAVLAGGLVVWMNARVPEGPTPVAEEVREPYDEGLAALRDGDRLRAIALLRQVPRGTRAYPRAQRVIGWDIYAEDLDRPEAGIPYVNRALWSDLGSRNAWQDAWRVYARALRR